MGRSAALALCLALGFFLAWAGERTPAPVPAAAPSTSFSAQRAMADVEALGARPHPIGSPANAAARDHLTARMAALGLTPAVQRVEVVRSHRQGARAWVAGGVVENVVGVLPGRDRAAPALALMAHYDSVPGSPGAADDAAGTAAALEIVRALKAMGTPARDVLVVLTDGEEAGLLGAQAFFDRHALAGRIGFLINMEARGGGGRAQMFQTGADNAGTVELLQRGSVDPAATSLTVFLYEQMPNDTDFSVSKAAGVPGLNYAFIDRQYDYHAPTSTPANLDQGALQHLGQEALAAARQAAFADSLPRKGPNLVYANVYGGRILAYRPPVGWLLLAGCAALIALGGGRARRAGALVAADVAKGAGAALYGLALGVAVLRLARQAAGAGAGFLEQHRLLAQAPRWEIALALLALGALLLAAAALGRGRTRIIGAALALALGAGGVAFGHLDPLALAAGTAGALLALLCFGRPAGTAGAWAGVIATGFLAACGLQAAAPTTAMLVTWPLLLACLAAAASAFAARPSTVALGLLALIGGVGLGWLLPFAHGVYLGLDMPELLAPIAWIAALLIWPLAQPQADARGARTSALAVLALGALAVGLVRFDPPWTARHPRPTHLAYYVAPETGRAFLISRVGDLAPWTRAALTADGGAVAKIRLPALRGDSVWAAPARVTPLPPVQAVFGADAAGVHQLTLAAPPSARMLTVKLTSDAALSDVSINGLPTAMLNGRGAQARIEWSGSQRLVLRFRAAGPGSLRADYAAEIPDQGARALPRPPQGLAGFGDSGAALVGGARDLAW